MANETPRFQITQAPGFATGMRFYQVGEEIDWEVPEGWSDAKYGKHFAEYGPSTSFKPLNKAAEKLLADHHEVVKAKNRPKPTVDDERFAKMEALHLQAMQSSLETQALLRRLLENQAEKEETEEAEEEVDGVKIKVRRNKK